MARGREISPLRGGNDGGRGTRRGPHGKPPFAQKRSSLSTELSPTIRSSCTVIYRPYLKPANCLFKHNKTAVPPFQFTWVPFSRARSMPFASETPHPTGSYSPLPRLAVVPSPPFAPSPPSSSTPSRTPFVRTMHGRTIFKKRRAVHYRCNYKWNNQMPRQRSSYRRERFVRALTFSEGSKGYITEWRRNLFKIKD